MSGKVMRGTSLIRTTMAGLLGAVVSIGAADLAAAAGACSDPLVSSLSTYALGTNNIVHFVRPGSPTQSTQVVGVNGNLIGLDFRPADGATGLAYGTTDTGQLYLIDTTVTPYTARLLSMLSPSFAGGYQSLMDFNAAANALRLIGSNDQNFAVTNNGGNLNRTVVQTPVFYVGGDPNAGVDPNITAGAYDTNVAGAARTTFYMIDYQLDTFVTIADRITANGDLKTIGPIVDERGALLNFAPAAGLDIYTTSAGNNVGFAVTGQDVYCIDLADVSADLPIGTQQKVVAEKLPAYSQEIARVARGGLIDIAVDPFSTAPVSAQADLALSVVDQPDPVRVGEQLTYSATIVNLGPQAATSVTLTTSPLPGQEGGGGIVRLLSSQGRCFVSASGAGVTCSLGTIDAGRTVTAQITTSGPVRSGVTFKTSFKLASDVADPNVNNNTVLLLTTAAP